MINTTHDINVIRETATYAQEEFKKILDAYTLHELDKKKLKLSNHKTKYQRILKIKSYIEKRQSLDKETTLRLSLSSNPRESPSLTRNVSNENCNEDVNIDSIGEDGRSAKQSPYNISRESKLYSPQHEQLILLANNESIYIKDEDFSPSEEGDDNHDVLFSRYLQKVNLIKEV
jgi:hypothetical protein